MMLQFWLFSMQVFAADAPVVEANGAIMLDGVRVEVHWDDGDTFAVAETGKRARLDGYNTLESYGPVHRFGAGPISLYANALAAGVRATSEVWTCASQKGEGGYGRLRVDCPGLRAALLREGFAHVFNVGGPGSETDLAHQQEAIDAKRGIWSEGAPEGIVTSVHSLDEKEGAKATYNRITNLATGEAAKHPHTNNHKPCEWVCGSGSCLLYVPYKQRYGPNRASCLQAGTPQKGD